jgi:hypothetical protein
MSITKVTLPEIMSAFESKTLKEKGALNIVYYNTFLEKDPQKLEQSKFLLKYIKKEQLFESVVTVYWDILVAREIINEDMMYFLMELPLCHPLDVITDIEYQLDYFPFENVRHRINRYENDYEFKEIYKYNADFIIKYLYFLIIMFAIRKEVFPPIEDYEIPGPKECIGYKMNSDMLKSDNKAVEFMESKEAKIIKKEALENFIKKVNLDDIDYFACSLLISVRFIEDFLNHIGKEFSIRATGEDLISYLDRDKIDDFYYDEM